MSEKNSVRRLVHISLIAIRWGDMDAFRHVNNIVYFQYMEQARAEYLSAMGLTVLPRGLAPVIVNASCTFLVPMCFPGTVEVRMYLGAIGNSSAASYYEIRRHGEETLCAHGESKLVWTDSSTGKSAPIPDDLRAKLWGLSDC